MGTCETDNQIRCYTDPLIFWSQRGTNKITHSRN